MKNSVLKQIYNYILKINNASINVYIEEKNENHIQFKTTRNSENKYNVEKGMRIIVNYKNKTYFCSFKFYDYSELLIFIVNYVEKELNIKKFVDVRLKKTKIKKVCNYDVKINKQKKYQIRDLIYSELCDYDSLTLTIYECNSKTYILSNMKNYILDIKKVYTKILLKGIKFDSTIFDFILLNNTNSFFIKNKIYSFIDKFKTITSIKINKVFVKSGKYELILSNYCGTVFHEMLGHNLEEEINKKYNFDLYKINNYVGNELITYIDKVKANKFINIEFDDYMNKVTNKVLIRNGIVKEVINSYRSEDYKFLPTARMTNTYIKANKASLPFRIETVNDGIYIYKIKYGRLYIEEQKFLISIDAGYIIKNGKYSGCISDVSFVLSISDFIKNIKYVGPDLNFVPTICGASSGNIYVFAGAPTIQTNKIGIEFINEK